MSIYLFFRAINCLFLSVDFSEAYRFSGLYIKPAISLFDGRTITSVVNFYRRWQIVLLRLVLREARCHPTCSFQSAEINVSFTIGSKQTESNCSETYNLSYLYSVCSHRLFLPFLKLIKLIRASLSPCT